MTIFLLSKKVACSKLLGKLKCAKSKSTAHVLKAKLSSCIKDLKRPAHKKGRSRLRLSRRLLIELLSLWRDIFAGATASCLLLLPQKLIEKLLSKV